MIFVLYFCLQPDISIKSMDFWHEPQTWVHYRSSYVYLGSFSIFLLLYVDFYLLYLPSMVIFVCISDIPLYLSTIICLCVHSSKVLVSTHLFSSNIFQWRSAINVVTFYVTILFNMVGFNKDATFSTFLMGLMGGIVNFISLITVDKYSRRFIFIIR